MQRKILILAALTLLFTTGLFVISASAEIGKRTTTSAVSEEVKATLRQQAILRAQETLKSQEWLVYLTPATPQRRAVTEDDVLTFTESTVKSRNLLAQGYNESNFTLNILDDGTASWETMQMKQLDGAVVDLVFLKGELKDGAMKGIISMQPSRGQKNNFTFSTVQPQVVATETAKKTKR